MAIKILLPIPVTVALGERSFSRLKLIKTYLSSRWLQINFQVKPLTITVIEKEVGAQIEFNNLINGFTQKRARKIVLASISKTNYYKLFKLLCKCT